MLPFPSVELDLIIAKMLHRVKGPRDVIETSADDVIGLDPAMTGAPQLD